MYGKWVTFQEKNCSEITIFVESEKKLTQKQWIERAKLKIKNAAKDWQDDC